MRLLKTVRKPREPDINQVAERALRLFFAILSACGLVTAQSAVQRLLFRIVVATKPFEIPALLSLPIVTVTLDAFSQPKESIAGAFFF